MKRNLILVPLHKTGTHHAPRGINGAGYTSLRNDLNNRLYEIRDADTGEVIERIEIKE